MFFVFVILIAVVVFVLFLKSKRNESFDTITEVETIGMKEIISVFKRPEVIEKLKSNADYKAVALKEQIKDGDLKISVAIFDSSKNEITENILQAWKAKRLESDLEEAFGDKYMLILQ